MKHTGMVSLHRDEGIYLASFTFYPGHPGTWYRRNGDPGDPPEPDEIELHEIVLHGNGGMAQEIEEPSDELVDALEQAIYEQGQE